MQQHNCVGQARPRVPMMPNRANVIGIVLSVKDAAEEAAPDLKRVEIIIEEAHNITGSANFMAPYKGRPVNALIGPEAAPTFQELVGRRISVEMSVVGDEKGSAARICSDPTLEIGA